MTKNRTTMNANVAPVASKPGRKSSVANMTPAQIKEQVEMLMADLRATTDGMTKKKIRRALRLRGHFGGLGQVKKAAPVAVVAPVVAPKAKKASKGKKSLVANVA